MITESTGDLLKAPVEALVNTVNTEGVMGKGIALQFKNAFPAMFREYARASKSGQVKLGSMHVWSTDALTGPQYIINFPTKGHWRSRSRISDIQVGLQDLVRVVEERNIRSIAIPPLGAGNGGLNWADVEPLIRQAFEALPDVDVRIYAPSTTPSANAMAHNQLRPEMRPGRAALVEILARYASQALASPSLIETQKLMYFLQIAGEPLRLDFQANRYGPYADGLRHVLKAVEGFFISGYGDGSARVPDAAPLVVLPGALEEAEAVLHDKRDTRARMDRVMELAAGFETAYGMELLATVHWVATHEPPAFSDAEISEKVAAWSPRKAQMFTARHVDVALDALRSGGWLTGVSNGA